MLGPAFRVQCSKPRTAAQDCRSGTVAAVSWCGATARATSEAESNMDHGYGVTCVVAGIDEFIKWVLNIPACGILEYLQLG